MTREDKIKYMKEWCGKNGLILDLEGGCGFGRECVGVTNGNSFPDYVGYDDDYNVIWGDEVWVPDNAYHKHPCVAVLGRDDESVDQLYQWLKWFDENGYVVSKIKNTFSHPLEAMLKGTHTPVIKKAA